MSRIAVVRNEDNVCVNIIVAEANDPAPGGCFLVDIDNTLCNIGWVYDPLVNDFVDPNPPPVVEYLPTEEDQITTLEDVQPPDNLGAV